MNPFEPALTNTDWNEEWMRLQTMRERFDSPEEWDARAKTFPVKHGSQEGYVSAFLEKANVKVGEMVLDMGCGTGALATPLAQQGNSVIACDFSQGMLNAMVEDQKALGVSGVTVKLLSWADDWSASGIEPKSVDVALASRSIATSNLKEALLKLDNVARRRVCITLPCTASPKSDERLLRAAGIEPKIGRDFLYAFNILASCGINPEVSYIPNTRIEVFSTRDEALETYTRIAASAARGVASEADLEAIPRHLAHWLDVNLVECEDGVRLAEPRSVSWAFIAWTPR